MTNPTTLVQKLCTHFSILRDDGLTYGDYVEPLTFLLFLKIAAEPSRPAYHKPSRIVAELERRLSVVEELEATVSASLQRAGRLRQARLQKAFTGALTYGY
jgi:type I restriction-modification system DNA methylase subunit